MWLSKNPRQEISRQILGTGILSCCYKQHKITKWLKSNNAKKSCRTSSYMLKFASQRVRFSGISCNMAFFNLTQLGVQDPIRAALRDDDKSAAENDGRNVNNVKVNLTAQREGGCKSYVKYTERLTKHQRSPKGKYY